MNRKLLGDSDRAIGRLRCGRRRYLICRGPGAFTKDIAPIFQKKLSVWPAIDAGTSAPMPLETYNQVRPWAKSIRRNATRRDMPPWHRDKTVGIRHYKNDRSLGDAEIATISPIGG